MSANLRLLTVEAVMTRTSLPRSAVYRLVKNGVLAHVRTGGKTSPIQIPEASLEAWVNSASAATSADTAPSHPSRLDADATLPAIDNPFA